MKQANYWVSVVSTLHCSHSKTVKNHEFILFHTDINACPEEKHANEEPWFFSLNKKKKITVNSKNVSS